jgi:acyl-CoA thioester hydrolase
VISAEIEVSIPFHDVDAMEIVWHGHYIRYFEIARCAALESVGYGYKDMKASGYSFPVTDLKVRYSQPAKFGQRVIVRAELKEWENRLRFAYLISDRETGQRLTRGETVQVAVDLGTNEMCFQCPPIVFQKLGLRIPSAEL